MLCLWYTFPENEPYNNKSYALHWHLWMCRKDRNTLNVEVMTRMRLCGCWYDAVLEQQTKAFIHEREQTCSDLLPGSCSCSPLVFLRLTVWLQRCQCHTMIEAWCCHLTHEWGVMSCGPKALVHCFTVTVLLTHFTEHDTYWPFFRSDCPLCWQVDRGYFQIHQNYLQITCGPGCWTGWCAWKSFLFLFFLFLFEHDSCTQLHLFGVQCKPLLFRVGLEVEGK